MCNNMVRGAQFLLLCVVVQSQVIQDFYSHDASFRRAAPLSHRQW